MIKPIVTIENADIYERGGVKLMTGDAINHPRFLPRTRVYTSAIKEIRDDGKTVETLNTIYKLV